MTIFYFTATGNSLAVAKRIGGNLVSIPQAIHQSDKTYKDDVIGLVLPIYGFAPPKIVRRFLREVKWEADYVFAIGTHGDRYAGFCQLLKKLCDRQNLRLDYVNTLKMVDNALIGYEMEEQIRTLPEKRVEEHLQGIIADIASRKSYIKPFEDGQRVRGRVIRLISPIMENSRIGAGMLTVDENCTKCGTCRRLCPVANITVADKVKFGAKCEMCLGCVHNCPKTAIHFKGEKSAARFRNPEVSLGEIIAANGQNRSKA